VILELTAQGILLRPVRSLQLEVYGEQRIEEFAGDEAEIGKLLPKRS
jgi:hypothetical protein